MISLLLTLLLVFGGAAIAQNETPMIFCGDLAQADCDLLTASQEAMISLTSASSNLDMSMTISNIPDMPVDEMAFRLTGEGSYSVDPTLVETIKGMQTNPAALFSNPDWFTRWMTDLVQGFSGDMSFTLELPAELVAMMGTEPAIPEILSFDVRMVDGYAYANLDSIAAALPDAGLPAGWVGVDLAGYIEIAMQQSEIGDAMIMDPEALQDYMAGIQDPAIMGDFMTIERGADTDIMGQAGATFVTTFDYGAFFSSEMFQNLMSAQMAAASSMSGEEMSDADKAEIDAAMAQMGPMFEGISLEITQVIGQDDKYIHTTEMHMNWDMSGFMTMVEPDADGPSPIFTFDLTVNNTNFNDVAEIVAPEDATIFPLESMMPSRNPQ